MPVGDGPSTAGLDALRRALLPLLVSPLLATTAPAGGPPYFGTTPVVPDEDDDPLAASISALVDLARQGDVEAFGQLYDHYNAAVYRFVFYRVSSRTLAEDLVSETFFRALRSVGSFQWQGRDFGAWLITIARNLVVDYYKSSRTRLESTTDDLSAYGGVTEGPESEVLAGLTHDIVRAALRRLPDDQQECLVLRFLNGQSIAETGKALGRSEGAVKQLQLRAIRNLAKQLPPGVR
jgi:RNA polymerase sigma-70 factor, ECF subfamily